MFFWFYAISGCYLTAVCSIPPLHRAPALNSQPMVTYTLYFNSISRIIVITVCVLTHKKLNVY